MILSEQTPAILATNTSTINATFTLSNKKINGNRKKNGKQKTESDASGIWNGKRKAEREKGNRP